MGSADLNLFELLCTPWISESLLHKVRLKVNGSNFVLAVRNAH